MKLHHFNSKFCHIHTAIIYERIYRHALCSGSPSADIAISHFSPCAITLNQATISKTYAYSSIQPAIKKKPEMDRDK